jgi:ribulose-5-phosphate 4-epimerase/fuculose-1-phosphate aldolase
MSKQLEEPVSAPTELRTRLALACRIIAANGLDVGVQGHLTHRDPQRHDTFWMNPFGLRFSEITADDLVRVDGDGKVHEGVHQHVNLAGIYQHGAVYAARPDVQAVVHTHAPHATAFSALATPFRLVCQDACSFFEDIVVYDQFTGVTDQRDDASQVAAALGNRRAAILRNHGILTVSRSIQQAVVDHVDLERLCAVQLEALACAHSAKLTEISPEVARHTKEPYVSEWFYLTQFDALVRLLPPEQRKERQGTSAQHVGHRWVPSRQ